MIQIYNTISKQRGLFQTSTSLRKLIFVTEVALDIIYIIETVDMKIDPLNYMISKTYTIEEGERL